MAGWSRSCRSSAKKIFIIILILKVSVYDAANDTVRRGSRSRRCSARARRSVTTIRAMRAATTHVDAAIDSSNRGVLYLNSRVRYERDLPTARHTRSCSARFWKRPDAGMGLGHTFHAAQHRRADRHGRIRLVGAAKLKPRYRAHGPREEIFETIETLAQDGVWPLELTGGFASKHQHHVQLSFLRRISPLAEKDDRSAGLRAAGQPRRWRTHQQRYLLNARVKSRWRRTRA